MELSLLPGQFSRRAEFYYQLAQFTAAGIPFVGALQQLERKPPAHSYRAPINGLLAELSHGRTISESLARIPKWLPDFDLALLKAGEESGRLDVTLRLLAGYYDERARMLRGIISDLAYPVFLFHFAVFLLPFSTLFVSGDWSAYLRQTLGVLLPVYAIVAAVILAGQSRHGETWRAIWERLLRAIPLLGSGRKSLALSRLCAALEALLSAGVTIIEAWDLAGKASGSPALRKTVERWKPHLEAGNTPSEMVSSSREFPEMFASQYASGEISGRLDDHLGRLRGYYLEDGTRKLRALAQWSPRLFYLAVVLIIGWKIVAFWQGYFNQIGEVLDF